MKTFKSISILAAVAMLAVSCLTGKGSDDDIPTPEPPKPAEFTVKVSASVIYANGNDAAVFDISYGELRLSEDDVTIYNADDDTEVYLPDLSFSTATPGEYAFYVKYVASSDEGEEQEFTSERIDITAITEVFLGHIEEEGLSVRLSSTVFQAGEDRAIFVIRFNGDVINEGYEIYDAQTNTVVEMPTMMLEAEDGTPYDLPVYTATEAGTRSFWVAYKTYNTVNKPSTITAVSFPVPMRPGDTQPDNTSFKHRAMLIQFTGLGCGYCPYMIAALRTVLADEEYGDKAVLAASHEYSGDPYDHNANLEDAMGISSYPTVVVDMLSSIGNYSYTGNVNNLKKMIDTSLSTPAKAGISARMNVEDNILVARMTIKAGETGEYRVGAWLLEDGLTGRQSNYGMEGEFGTHDAVLRILDSSMSRGNFTGHSLGTLGKGDMADHLFVMNLDPSWVQDNCRLLLFVTTANGTRYSVTNAVASDGLTGTIEFEYE
ncbi:MAG: Omp28-related outer membrane protein [Alistipes sp.]|nr:Omp28-related outer membrane protein [Alistipes sp.]MDE7128998.1 Omp28-related outer membrane protein [Alistipes sp.]